MSIHIVTGPVAVARQADGHLVYVYNGAALPDSVPADEVARLVETGLVEKVKDPLLVQPMLTTADREVVERAAAERAAADRAVAGPAEPVSKPATRKPAAS